MSTGPSTTENGQTSFVERREEDTEKVALSEIKPTETTGSSARLERSVDSLGIFFSSPALRKTSGGEYKYEVVAGRRRVRAAIKNPERDTIPAVVLPTDTPKEVALLIFLLENFARNDSPLEEAEALIALLHDHGWDRDQLAEYGIPKKKQRKLVRLWNAPDPILDGVREGSVAVGTAVKVSKLDERLQKRCVRHYKENDRLLGRHVDQIKTVGKDEEADSLPDDLFHMGADEMKRAEESRQTSIDTEGAERARDRLKEAVRDGVKAGVSETELLRIVHEAL